MEVWNDFDFPCIEIFLTIKDFFNWFLKEVLRKILHLRDFEHMQKKLVMYIKIAWKLNLPAHIRFKKISGFQHPDNMKLLKVFVDTADTNILRIT